jgi:hypothetical protein
VPESTVEKGNDLYVEDTVRPEVWIICGEHDSTVNKNVYVYDILLLPIPFFLVLIMAHLKALRRSPSSASLLLLLGSIGILKPPVQALRYLLQDDLKLEPGHGSA